MEEAVAVRRAASEATADVVPEALRETIDEYVADGSAVPGVLTLLSARAVAGEDPEGLPRQAAGVQLIYDGLRLTRELAQGDPWGETDPVTAPDGDADADADADANADANADADEDDGLRTDGAAEADQEEDADRDPNMAILAADVLVSRGFYLLARTDAAEDAVGVVRAFGRDQTDRETAGEAAAATLDRNLERDVLELAVTTGVAAAGGRRRDDCDLAAEFAPEAARFSPADAFFDDGRRDRLASLTIDGGRPLNRND